MSSYISACTLLSFLIFWHHNYEKCIICTRSGGLIYTTYSTKACKSYIDQRQGITFSWGQYFVDWHQKPRGVLKELCDGSRMRTTIHYVVIKPDSRSDGTAFWDHVHVRVLHAILDTERSVSMTLYMHVQCWMWWRWHCRISTRPYR